jgi:hypothetical protein
LLFSFQRPTRKIPKAGGFATRRAPGKAEFIQVRF